ncbi:MAG: 2-oxoglutarate dehydrogenase E1 component, partial [Xanthobacteraceae bacterium]
MSRQDANAAFALSSFLYGGNAAYIEDLHARFQADPNAVEGEWREFFQSLREDPGDVRRNARGPSWARSNWPIIARDETISALDGQWEEVARAVGDKIKAK